MIARDQLHGLREQITKEQVGRIRDEFERQGIAVRTVSGEDGAAYTYAADQILVREDSVSRVRDFLGTVVTPDAPVEVIPGVRLVTFGPQRPGQPTPPVLELVHRIRQAIGPVAGPNHLLTVAPETGPCPATEAEEVDFDIEPFPAVRTEDDGSDGSGARIYVADTGLLADASSYSWLSGVEGAPDPLDPQPGDLIQPYCGHGEFVAACIRCMAPKAYVYVSNVFKTAGSALESDLIRDLAAALDQGFDIFNLSITTPSRGQLDMIGFEAWRELLRRHPGVVCVVAAGNDGMQAEFWPAAFPEMVSVGALAADWRSRASFSNYGGWVKVYAPGRDLVNAYATGIYECQDAPYTGQIRRFYGMARWSGTSFATPPGSRTHRRAKVAARRNRQGSRRLPPE